jgi:hypothetical protein
MTMLSFRTDEEQADLASRWADQLGLDRSELLRQALRRHLAQLAATEEPDVWRMNPLTAEEASLGEIAEWGPAEDWSDWVDEAR